MVSRWWKYAALALLVLFIVGTIAGQTISIGSGSAGTGDIRPTTMTTP